MKRRILSFVVMAAIFIGTLGGTVFAAETHGQLGLQGSEISLSGIELNAAHSVFQDVQDTDWFYEDVSYAYDNGLFTGTTATTFEPEAAMTRAMFATVVFRLCDSKGLVSGIGNPYFTDVKSTDYYYNAVTWCYNAGIIEGVGDGKFAPNESVSRQQAATILGRLISTEGHDIIPVTYTDSNSIADWAVEYVNIMANYGLMTGNTDGSFTPLKSLTRAQAAKVLTILHRDFVPVTE